MTYTVTPYKDGKISLNERDTLKSVLQNVAIILRTIKGSCPMYRDFGVNATVIDRPIPAAKALLYSQVREAVEKYEPRARVVQVDFDQTGEMNGTLIPIVEVEIVDESQYAVSVY